MKSNTSNTNNIATYNYGGIRSENEEYEAKQRLMQLGNKKGISSEDIFGAKEQKSQEIIDRYSALKGAKAISSDMFFGEKEESGNGSEKYDSAQLNKGS